MAKLFDARMRFLLATDPAAWVACASLAADGPATIVDSNLSAISAAADAAVRIDGPSPWLAHFEFQSSGDPLLGLRLLRYNVQLGYRDELPVRSVAVLLSPRADRPKLTGTYLQRSPDGRAIRDFRFDVVRVCEKPVAEGLGTLPLAPISKVSPSALPGVIRRMEQRFADEVERSVAGELRTATGNLMGLKYRQGSIESLLKGVRDMEESTFYQAILRKGKAQGKAEGMAEGQLEEPRRIIIRQGRKRLGEPVARAASVINAIDDLEQIESLLDRVLDASDWDDLLSSR